MWVYFDRLNFKRVVGKSLEVQSVVRGTCVPTCPEDSDTSVNALSAIAQPPNFPRNLLTFGSNIEGTRGEFHSVVVFLSKKPGIEIGIPKQTPARTVRWFGRPAILSAVIR